MVLDDGGYIFLNKGGEFVVYNFDTSLRCNSSIDGSDDTYVKLPQGILDGDFIYFVNKNII